MIAAFIAQMICEWSLVKNKLKRLYIQLLCDEYMYFLSIATSKRTLYKLQLNSVHHCVLFIMLFPLDLHCVSKMLFPLDLLDFYILLPIFHCTIL